MLYTKHYKAFQLIIDDFLECTEPGIRQGYLQNLSLFFLTLLPKLVEIEENFGSLESHSTPT